MYLLSASGKTSVAVALKHLFGFGHVQNDDIRAKKTVPIFLQKIKSQLEKHDVVIADKYVYFSLEIINLDSFAAGITI